ncbi:44831_t:CDS:2 [Gigaspora margarita]|uniref:44831_t:CDS:1 n=1 Tax=Gigaspora margarita TaxID=4874 RepID=A0ABN7UPA7_GIGMA|nr:44831_t:CDS:2 [Gigaspora margarita]
MQERPDQVRSDEAKPDEARPDEARPDKARPDEARPDEARPDEARADKARLNKARPNEVRLKETKPDKIRPIEARPMQEFEISEPNEEPVQKKEVKCNTTKPISEFTRAEVTEKLEIKKNINHENTIQEDQENENDLELIELANLSNHIVKLLNQSDDNLENTSLFNF